MNSYTARCMLWVKLRACFTTYLFFSMSYWTNGSVNIFRVLSLNLSSLEQVLVPCESGNTCPSTSL